MALAIPLIAIPTLDIVATAQPAFEGELLGVAQAGRGRVCAARYTWKLGAWNASSETEIIVWDSLIEKLDADVKWLIAGEIDDSARRLIAASSKSLRIAPP